MADFTPSAPFVAARGLESPHAQTIFASLARPKRTPILWRERWDTPDGDFLDVDLLRAPKSAPYLLVLHGLEGSSQAGYVAAILRIAARLGWGALALNFRSCSGEPNRLARSYHSGETEDPLFALERLRRRVDGPIFGVGFSLGGNVLLRMVQERGEESLLGAAVAISAPYDLLACARSLDSSDGWMRLYRERFLRSLKRKALDKAHRHGGIDPARVKAAQTIEAFDDAVTAPLHGFESAMAYYRFASSGRELAKIRRPTLLISAEDDPLAPARCLPGDATENPHLSLLFTARGGHVGFVGGSAFAPRYWAEEQALRFLQQHAQQ